MDTSTAAHNMFLAHSQRRYYHGGAQPGADGDLSIFATGAMLGGVFYVPSVAAAITLTNLLFPPLTSSDNSEVDNHSDAATANCYLLSWLRARARAFALLASQSQSFAGAARAAAASLRDTKAVVATANAAAESASSSEQSSELVLERLTPVVSLCHTDYDLSKHPGFSHLTTSQRPPFDSSIFSVLLLLGVSPHHSALPPAHRRLAEFAFASRVLAVITATTTLAAGVNLPASVVVLTSHLTGITPLTPPQLKQMAGRAGRMGADAATNSTATAAESKTETDADADAEAVAVAEAAGAAGLCVLVSGIDTKEDTWRRLIFDTSDSERSKQ